MKIELDQVALGGVLTVVHMKQVFGTDSYYIQDEGRGHETLFVPFWPANPGENTASNPYCIQPILHPTIVSLLFLLCSSQRRSHMYNRACGRGF